MCLCVERERESSLPFGSLIALDSAQLVRSTCCLNDNFKIDGASNFSNWPKNGSVTSRYTSPSQVRPVLPRLCSAYHATQRLNFD